MIKVGITGNIGSGKSMVCSLFQMLGIPVWQADIEARRIMVEDPDVRSRVITLLGDEAYSGQALNKDHIAQLIFSEPGLRKELDRIVHPAVQRAVMQWFSSLPPKTGYAIEEAALLVESEGYRLLDRLIVVTAPESLRIQRVLQRDDRPLEIVLKQVRSQLPESEKESLADFIIVNDGEHLLIPQVLRIHSQLLDLAQLQ